MGLLRKRGENFFCHPLLWGGHLPPCPPSSYAPEDNSTSQGQLRVQSCINQRIIMLLLLDDRVYRQYSVLSHRGVQPVEPRRFYGFSEAFHALQSSSSSYRRHSVTDDKRIYTKASRALDPPHPSPQQWRHGRGSEGQLPPILACRKITFKEIQNLGLEIPHFEETSEQLYHLFRRKFAPVVGKMQLRVPNFS